jgi:hypothetical protein
MRDVHNLTVSDAELLNHRTTHNSALPLSGVMILQVRRKFHIAFGIGRICEMDTRHKLSLLVHSSPIAEVS